jgi:hypothetical protein
MLKRLMLAFVVAIVTAPTMYAGAYPFSSPHDIPWEKLSAAAAEALCRTVGLCFAHTP